MHPQTQEFSRLFEGWNKNYGIYKLTGEIDERGKVKGQAHSLAGEMTLELWNKHLTGKQGLGVIPITDKSEVKFAAIDIDDYEVDVKAILKQIIAENFPLVACRTKSGGLHLYLFLTDWTSAKIVQTKMREMAAALGYGSAEIFPKQHTILASRGDIGQWINMPYFNAASTDRYGYTPEGAPLKVENFVRYCFDKMQEPEQFVSTKFREDGNELLSEGPPCLNHLVVKGFPMGTRNNGLFNLGIYAQKVAPDSWQTLLHTYNTKFMDPPLTSSEVSGVIKSLNKAKGYNYTCKQQPIVNFCNLNKCRACKFGVGVGGVGMPKYGTLCKINTKPPIWFVDVEGGGRVELETEDLQFVRRYQTQVLESSSIMPPLIKPEIWGEIISKLLADVTLVEIPEESTPRGMLRQYLNEFCTSRAQGKSSDELLLGKPWRDEERGYVYFRMRDFMTFLDRMRFKEYAMNHVACALKDWGSDKHFFNIRGHGVNCIAMPINSLTSQTEPFPVPDTSTNTVI